MNENSESPTTALLDANIFPMTWLMDLILSLADENLLEPLWSDSILAEARQAVLRSWPQEALPQSAMYFQQIHVAYPYAAVTGYEPLIDTIADVPDPDDRHVMAAAVKGGAQYIVTFNLKDFPPERMGGTRGTGCWSRRVPL